jgi:hypothetical protein
MADWQILALVAVLLPLMWLVIAFFAVTFGPWRRLVSRYPVNQWVPTVSKAYFVSMDCGLMSYGNCLVIDFSDDTMTVRMGANMLPFHQPFMVPKTAIQNFRRGRLLFIDWIKFQVDDCRFLLWGPNTRTNFFDGLE